MDESRTLSNPEVSKLAAKLVQRLEVELRGMMLTNPDAALVLLAAAHGRARASGWSSEELVRRAAATWDHCDQGREPVKRSLDFNVRDLPQRLFLDAGRVGSPK
jgi:hypothetical protein